MNTTHDDVDEALEETFPASDPAAKSVATGIRVAVDAPFSSQLVVRDHREASRFEASIEGELAVLQYERRPAELVLLHTEVPESQRGRGIGTELVKVVLESVRAQGLAIVARCPFVRAYLDKHRSGAER